MLHCCMIRSCMHLFLQCSSATYSFTHSITLLLCMPIKPPNTSSTYKSVIIQGILSSLFIFHWIFACLLHCESCCILFLYSYTHPQQHILILIFTSYCASYASYSNYNIFSSSSPPSILCTLIFVTYNSELFELPGNGDYANLQVYIERR